MGKCMKKMFILKNLLSLLVISLLTSCVGTVEEAGVDGSFTTVVNEINIQFTGVEEVVGISDSRIEVFFRPAQGESGKYNYKINLGGGLVPVSVPTEVLATTDYRGYLKYTLKDLNPGYLYKISIDVQDQESKLTYKTDKVLEARTFFQKTCNFNGIDSVENLPGTAGTDSLTIKWSNAEVTSKGIKPDKGDPREYEITLIDAKSYKPSNFFDVDLLGGVGRYTTLVTHDEFSSEYVYRGLPSGTEFFIKVRCYNKEESERPGDKGNPQYDGEMNTNYVKIATLDDTLASIDYDADKILLIRGSGEDATKTFSITWDDVQGVFDHYRIYYTQNATFDESNIIDDCSVNVPDNSQGGSIYCKKIPYNENRVQVFPLASNSLYQVAFVLCQDLSCSTGKRIMMKTWEYDTRVPDSAFFGLTSISAATRLQDLGKLTLAFAKPDSTNGTFDGYTVLYKSGSLTATAQDITDPDTYTGQIEVEPYTTASDEKLTLTNVDYGQTHCFNVGIFRWKTDGTKQQITNEAWSCITPEVLAPSNSEFTGLTEGESTSRFLKSALTIYWDLPTQGVYERYVVFLKHNGATSFSFNDAINETSVGNYTNYYRYEINDPAAESFSLDYVTPGGSFVFGILTEIVTRGGSFHSTNNTAIITCNVPASPANENDPTFEASCTF